MRYQAGQHGAGGSGAGGRGSPAGGRPGGRFWWRSSSSGCRRRREPAPARRIHGQAPAWPVPRALAGLCGGGGAVVGECVCAHVCVCTRVGGSQVVRLAVGRARGCRRQGLWWHQWQQAACRLTRALGAVDWVVREERTRLAAAAVYEHLRGGGGGRWAAGGGSGAEPRRLDAGPLHPACTALRVQRTTVPATGCLASA